MKDVKKLEELKNNFQKAAMALLDEMYAQDVDIINGYPEYLPSFDEFVCDLYNIEFEEE